MKNFRHVLSSSKTRFRLLILVAVVGVLGSLATLSNASPSQLTVTVVNNSDREVRYLYLSPADNDNWGTDQLNDSSIGSGATRTLNVSWDQSTVKLVAEDVDGCFMYLTVEATGSPVWTITGDTARNCGN